MLKKLSIFVFILLALPTLVFSQSNKQVMKKAPVILEEPNTSGIPAYTSYGTGTLQSPTAATWVLVDTSGNAFGGASPTLNPVAYDPSANVVAVVHRGKSTYGTSGQIWYNISTDKGVTWTRVPSAVNISNPTRNGRYPSMAISNPTGGDLSATTGLFGWPELNTTAFGWVGYGADQPVGAGVTFSGIEQVPNDYGSNVPCWASDNSTWLFWACDVGTTGDARIDLWRTQDFQTITKTTPFTSAMFEDGSNVALGGVSHNGVQYYGVLGTFPDPDTTKPIISGWYPGYSKSTDNGATWSAFKVVDFRTIPALNKYDRLFDSKKGDAFISYDGDINVDANGYVHIVTAVTDTVGSNNTGVNAVVELIETASGWDGKVVFEGLVDTVFAAGPGLGQMGSSPYLAFNKARNVLGVQWSNSTATSRFCDVFFAYRALNGNWSAPINLTESDNINNTQHHLAPTLAQTGSNFNAFSYYGYVAGATGPFADSTLATAIYIAAVPFNVTVGIGDEVSLVNNFELVQNYPNPFNPTTSIKYTISERANVSLKVFDVLGRDVADLVNANKDAGSYEVNFDASSLSSGLYIYTLKTGNFSASKKMMLMK